MEKLQAALAKARQTRQEGTEFAMRPPVDGVARSPDSTDAIWENLTEIDVNGGVLEKNRIVTQTANTKAAAFDILRTKVLLHMRQNNWTRLAITSPMPDSGKTTTACNLALSLGRQSDLRSMVLDFDLRDPSVHQFLDQTPNTGMADVLEGRVEFADQAVRIGKNVAFGMANKAETDPARLLLAENTTKIVDQIELEYKPDVMIFDLPSILVNDDTRAFLKNVDCALIVLRANKTRYSQFDVSEREISEQTNVLGVVLNAYQHSDNGRAET